MCVSLLACLCRAQRAWRRCVPGHVSWSGMQPGPCNMTRRQPVSGSWTRLSPVRPVLSAMRSADPMTARGLGPKVPHATIRVPWPMVHGQATWKASKLEARHSTRGTPRIESVVLGFCCINWPFRHSTWRHQMTPMDPLFPRSAKRGRRRGSPALLKLTMMGGPILSRPPVPAAQVDIVPASRFQSPESGHVQHTLERGFCRHLMAGRSNQ